MNAAHYVSVDQDAVTDHRHWAAEQDPLEGLEPETAFCLDCGCPTAAATSRLCDGCAEVAVVLAGGVDRRIEQLQAEFWAGADALADRIESKRGQL